MPKGTQGRDRLVKGAAAESFPENRLEAAADETIGISIDHREDRCPALTSLVIDAEPAGDDSVGLTLTIEFSEHTAGPTGGSIRYRLTRAELGFTLSSCEMPVENRTAGSKSVSGIIDPETAADDRFASEPFTIRTGGGANSPQWIFVPKPSEEGLHGSNEAKSWGTIDLGGRTGALDAVVRVASDDIITVGVGNFWPATMTRRKNRVFRAAALKYIKRQPYVCRTMLSFYKHKTREGQADDLST
jgi:hypothetical protein